MKATLVAGICVTLATALEAVPSSPALQEWGQRLGWTLIHSIWQVTLIALAAQIISLCLHRRSAQSRYVAGVLFLALMLIVPVVTSRTIAVAPVATDVVIIPAEPIAPAMPLMVGVPAQPADRPLELADSPPGLEEELLQEPNPANTFVSPSELPRQPVSAMGFIVTFESIRQALFPWLGCVVTVWLVGVVLCGIRPIVGLWTQFRLQCVGLTAVSGEIQQQVLDLSRRLRITAVVRVAESALVTVPMVVGYLKPIILIPASVLIGLTPGQLESLLAHELAHVRRHDWIVNALQVLVETLLFYHPAVWWLSNRIRCERELSCDDLALSLTRDALTYGRMLLTLEVLRSNHGTAALAATDGDLTQRVQRLLPGYRATRRSPRDWLAGIVLLGVSAALVIGGVAASRSAADQSQATSNEPQSKDGDEKFTASESGSEKNAPTVADDQKLIVRGRITMSDDSPLPQDLKLQRRITGSNFAEQVKDVKVDEHGEFEFEVQHDAAFVNLYATTSQSAPGSAARFEVKRGQPIEPVAIILPRGFTATLRLRDSQGKRPHSGTATVSIRNSFEPTFGVFAVAPNGDVTIPHCPEGPVQVDLLVPGFEEQRIHQSLSKSPMDLVITPAATARFRLVDNAGQPVSGARVRLFSRVRADSFLRPRQEWGDGPVWATSDADGRVELKTLCQIDPVPTNDPGPCEYAFRIDADRMASRYVGGVRAGSDLGQIVLTEPLDVRGEIVRTSEPPERVSVQWRQRTVAQGGTDDKQSWESATLEDVEGRLQLHLTGLQPGPLDLFIAFSDPKADPNSFAVVKQLEFHGLLQASSAGLKITRDTVKPGDEHLLATRESLFPIDDFPPSNLPRKVRQQLVPEGNIEEGGDGKVSLSPPMPPLRETMLSWSATAPVQHSMGHVQWRLIVLADGTVFVPGSGSDDAGAWHRLTVIETEELTSLMDRYADYQSLLPEPRTPEQGGWRYGHDTLQYTRQGKTRSFVSWHGPDPVPIVSPDLNAVDEQKRPPSYSEVTSFLDRLITEACSGGRTRLQSYRDLANRALKESVKTARPFTESDWCSATIHTDGTRFISCANLADNCRVDLEHPVGGQPFVRNIEFQQRRMPLPAVVPPSPPTPEHEGQARNGIPARVKSLGTPVQSGPGVHFYATDTLLQGDRVTIHRDEPGGWSMIAPPPGSFSWIRADQVQRSGDSTGVVNSHGVVVHIGSALNAEDYKTIQGNLSKGDTVQILGERSMDFEQGPRRMFKIRPIAQEWRWVKTSAIDREIAPVTQLGWGRKMLDPVPIDFGTVIRGDVAMLPVKIKNVYREEIQLTGLKAQAGLEWQTDGNEHISESDFPLALASGEERVLYLRLTVLDVQGTWNSRVQLTLVDPIHESTDHVILLVRANFEQHPENLSDPSTISRDDLETLKRDVAAYEKVLAAAESTDAGKELIRHGIRYRLEMVCVDQNKAQVHREDLLRDLISIGVNAGNRVAVPGFHDAVLEEVTSQIGSFLKSRNNFYSRMNLIILLGELSHARNDLKPDEPPQPYEAAAPMLIQILATPKDPVAIKVVAARGLKRLLRHGELDAAIRANAAETATDELKRGSNDWYQLRLIQCLAAVDLIQTRLDNNPVVVETLKSILADEKRTMIVRGEAAHALGRVQIPAAEDATSVTKAVERFAHQALADAATPSSVLLKLYLAFQPSDVKDLMVDRKSKSGLINNPKANARATYDELLPRLRPALHKRLGTEKADPQ
ncbi:MAG: M56 family metallopeptidase [Planctomycetes bacterium]|nr:M56 family metallopeptidase [Planctomycetota bacterium]